MENDYLQNPQISNPQMVFLKYIQMLKYHILLLRPHHDDGGDDDVHDSRVHLHLLHVLLHGHDDAHVLHAHPHLHLFQVL